MRLGAVGLVLTLAACVPDDGSLLVSARDYMAKQEFRAAAIQLKNVVQKKPALAEAHFLLSRALLETGDLDGADLELRRAIDLKYSPTETGLVRSRLLLARRDYAQVVKDFGDHLPAEPAAAAEQEAMLATAHAMLGERDEATAAVDKALAAQSGNATAIVMKARLEAASGDADAALRRLQALLAQAPNDVDALYLQGDIQLYAKADPAAAVASYRQALAARKDLPDIHARLITHYLAGQDVDAAQKQLAAMKSALPDHPQTRLCEAQIAFYRGDYAQARDLVQPLLRAQPDHVKGLQLAGAAELQLGGLERAESLLGRAVRLAPGDGDGRRLLAEVLLRKRQPAGALAAVRPLIDGGRPTPAVLSVAAQANVAMGNVAVAQAQFERAAQLRPQDPHLKAAAILAGAARGGADGEAASIALDRIAAADPGTSVNLEAISAHLARKDFDGAAKAIAALARKQPDSPLAPTLQGRLLLSRNDEAGARKSFDAALAKAPGYLPAADGLAALDVRQHRPEAAIERYQALLKQDPRNVQALVSLADLRRRTGAKPDEIAKLFGDAVASNPVDESARLAQVDFLVEAGNPAGALAAAQAGAAAVPTSIDLWYRVGTAQLSLGNREEAIGSFSKIVDLRPDRALGYIGLASAHFALQDLDTAARDARRALEREPDSIAAARLTASLAVRRQRPQDALVVARQMQAARPGDAYGYVAEGEVELAAKHWDAAAAAFRKALDKPEPSHAAARLHTTLLQARRRAEADKFAASWAGAHPQDAMFSMYLGDAAAAQGDLAGAEAHYLAALRAQPDSSAVLNNLAWVMMRENKPGALAYAERAVKADPGQAAFQDTLAMVLSHERQHARAIDIQKTVVARLPGVPKYRLDLARIYVQAGDKAGAKAELDRLAKLGNEFPGHDEVAALAASLGKF